MRETRRAVLFAVLAAALYAINIPASKYLLQRGTPAMLAAFLYLGAGLGLLLWSFATGCQRGFSGLTEKDLPYTLGMILLDIAAPILLMCGLTMTSAANASLLNNFEIVATTMIAYFILREPVSGKLAMAVILVTAASIALSFEGRASFAFHAGSICVLGASCCWGMENNCTRMLSGKSSVQITTIKGIFSGIGSLIVAFLSGESFPTMGWLLTVMLLGFISYGLSINFYIRAQKTLGATKTSAHYSIAPFLGAAFSMILLQEKPDARFCVGLVIMAAAAALMSKDTAASVE